MQTTSELLLRGWELHPTVIAGCAGLLGTYAVSRPRSPLRLVAFSAGVFVLLLSLISPLDPLGDEYLFSAHMVQHLLLILAVPPLLIFGISAAWVQAWMRYPSIAFTKATLGAPLAAWTANMGSTMVWHLPALYNAANASTGVHIFEHLTFLISGCMFWWPLCSPQLADRLMTGPAIAYLFGAVTVNTLLGIVLTFLPLGYYSPYVYPEDTLGALHLIRDVWGISASVDQRLAGLIMWIPGCSVYFIVILVEIGYWYQTPGPDRTRRPASRRRPGTDVQSA